MCRALGQVLHIFLNRYVTECESSFCARPRKLEIFRAPHFRADHLEHSSLFYPMHLVTCHTKGFLVALKIHGSELRIKGEKLLGVCCVACTACTTVNACESLANDSRATIHNSQHQTSEQSYIGQIQWRTHTNESLPPRIVNPLASADVCFRCR